MAYLPPDVDLARLYDPPADNELLASISESLYGKPATPRQHVKELATTLLPSFRFATSPPALPTYDRLPSPQAKSPSREIEPRQPQQSLQSRAGDSRSNPSVVQSGDQSNSVKPNVGKASDQPMGKGIKEVAFQHVDEYVAPHDGTATFAFLDQPTSERRGRSSEAWCLPCSAKVRGPLPTTLHEDVRGPRTDCGWKSVPSHYLSNWAAGLDAKLEMKVAKVMCLQLDELCRGITCTGVPASCDLRAGPDLMPSPAESNEITYVKECPARAQCLKHAVAVSPSVSNVQKERETSSVNAVVVLAHNRKQELSTCLDSLFRQADIGLFNVHVSLDDPLAFEDMNAVVLNVSRTYGASIGVWKTDPINADPSKHNEDQIKWFNMNAGKIAHHYWVALEAAFMEHGYEQVIFVEEDLVFAPDFLALFRSTMWLLEKDPSLWCISSWNDFAFEHSAFDQCRLLRTSYFPGLGFLLRKDAWMRLREMWPTCPTMGWDYWMRVAFRSEGKECIIPEVSRSHHVSAKGSSIHQDKQLRLLSAMAFASIPSSCDRSEPCLQFGDVSYLLEDVYEQWIRRAISNSPHLPLSVQNPYPRGLEPGALYVVPYVLKELKHISDLSGMHPKGTKNAIPADVRAEHYGVLSTIHVHSGARLLLVDRASHRPYLSDEERVTIRPDMRSVASKQGESCDEACSMQKLQCDVGQMQFVNDCHTLKEHFKCDAGCAHQVGKELPVYVPDNTQPTYGQCLVTFISPMNCQAKHPSTSRVCACAPGPGRP